MTNNTKMKDDLGTRMKNSYEDRTRYFLPRRTYTLIRLDGKAFHTFTKGMKRPYDLGFMDVMDKTAKFLCQNIQGCRFAYTQSDEISILMTDFDKTTTDAWFDGNIQKIVSVSASMATAKFNEIFYQKTLDKLWGKHQGDANQYAHSLKVPLAFFDARVWTIPDPIEVENYFIWRQKDAMRNSVHMTARSLYSHKELNGKSSSEQQDMIHAKGQNWNDMPDGFKRGRIVEYSQVYDIESGGDLSVIEVNSSWEIKPALDFLKVREKLTQMIPRYGTE